MLVGVGLFFPPRYSIMLALESAKTHLEQAYLPLSWSNTHDYQAGAVEKAPTAPMPSIFSGKRTDDQKNW